MQKARILLSSTDVDSLNEICSSIKELAQKTKMNGPIPLPTKKLKITTRKTPCGNGKASFDHFEMRVHKRLIDLGIDERALRLIMRVPIPEGVQITIDLLD
ncbi:MAG: 30S ribosomal protein S10 [Candidatus Nanoarchaeia archaeon]|nr:30S ribosomal protein S10 [Candidatus Nanoarchaeia archaeon]